MAHKQQEKSLYKTVKQLFVAAWNATEGHRPRFLLFISLFFLSYTVDLLVPVALGMAFGEIAKNGITDDALRLCQIYIGAYVALKLIHTCCHHVARYLQQTVAFSSRIRTLREVFSTLLAFPLSWHVTRHSGESLTKLHRFAGAIEQVIGNYVWQITEGMVKLVATSLIIFALDFWVAVNVLTMGVITVLLMILFNRRWIGAMRRNNVFNEKLGRVLVDHLHNIVTIKSLHLEYQSDKYLVKTEPEGLAACKQMARLGELKWGCIGCGYALVFGSSLWIYLSQHRGFTNPSDIAMIFVLQDYLNRIFQAIGSFTGYYSSIVESATAYEDATSIKADARQYQDRSDTQTLPKDWKTLTIDELEFQYDIDKNGSGIRAEKLELMHGDKIAIVGPSGSGKSTLLKVLGGMLIPTNARFTVDGSRSIELRSIAGTSLLLPQEPEVFSETVRYNMTMGEEFTQEKLQFYLSLCRVEEVLAKLPNGWESNLAEKGLNLSVGEKQRFALARGLLRAEDRDFLLLDEPTSSLDPMNEKKIFLGILNHFQNSTIITACHRLALVPLFDKIIFVRYGKIEEVGSFSELLARRGAFFEAWDDYERKIKIQGALQELKTPGVN